MKLIKLLSWSLSIVISFIMINDHEPKSIDYINLLSILVEFYLITYILKFIIYELVLIINRLYRKESYYFVNYNKTSDTDYKKYIDEIKYSIPSDEVIIKLLKLSFDEKIHKMYGVDLKDKKMSNSYKVDYKTALYLDNSIQTIYLQTFINKDTTIDVYLVNYKYDDFVDEFVDNIHLGTDIGSSWYKPLLKSIKLEDLLQGKYNSEIPNLSRNYINKKTPI